MHLTHPLSGYIFLVLLAILAPSPIPIPLDGIIVGLIGAGFNPVVVLILAITGDVIGTTLIYLIGLKGRSVIAEYRKRKNHKDYIIAERLFLNYGQYSLLLSGIPFLGDALIFLAGFFRLKPRRFILWFLLGKALWYLLFGALIIISRHSIFQLFH